MSRPTIKLPRTTIERKLNCREFLFQILAKILARFLARIYLGKILARFLPRSWQEFFLPRSWKDSWQDLAKNLSKILPRTEIGTILARPHEVLARSWQDLANFFFVRGNTNKRQPAQAQNPEARHIQEM